MENINAIVERIENSPNPLPRNESKGVIGRSPLLNYFDFDLVENLPTEYMHIVCLGVGKRLVELTFNVGQTRVRVTKRKLSDPEDFNRLIRNVQVPYELPRRCRNLDFAVLKATEFRNILIIFFPLVIQCVDVKYVTERKLWLQLAYIIPACVLSNDEFNVINPDTISSLAQKFYKNYEKVYGSHNCTYSVHVVSSHILQIRGKDPLTSRSAFMFENFYAEMKNLFCPGTVSPLKQIMKNCFMKRQLDPHTCKNSIKYSTMPHIDNRNIGKENNHCVYVLKNNVHCMYNIMYKNDDNTFSCVKQGKFDLKFKEVGNLDWKKVGVYQLGPVCSQPVVIREEEIMGKVICFDKYLITCPNNVLTEK